MVALMIDVETPSFTRAGFTFSLTTTTRASAMADNKTALFKALRDNGHGGLVYETVNANNLSAFVREQIENRQARLARRTGQCLRPEENQGTQINKKILK